MRVRFSGVLFVLGLLLVLQSRLFAGCVTLDFGDEEGVIQLNANPYEFFADKDSAFATQARAAIQQAANDVSNMIDCSALTAVDSTNNPAIASAGGTTVSVTSSYSYNDPYDDNLISIMPAAIPAQTVTLFVGGRMLDGNTLGEGGLGGIGVGVSVPTGVTSVADLETAFDVAAAQADTTMRRGSNVLSGPLSPMLSVTSGSVTSTFTEAVSYGVAVGHLWFDFDTDNDDDGDTLTELMDYWHVDHTTLPTDADTGERKNDLYSVAVHEILHAIGLSDHLPADTSSTTLVGGFTQEAAMDPSLTLGERKYLTVADRQFAADVGWAVTAVPEPGTLLHLSFVGFCLAGMQWLRRPWRAG